MPSVACAKQERNSCAAELNPCVNELNQDAKGIEVLVRVSTFVHFSNGADQSQAMARGAVPLLLYLVYKRWRGFLRHHTSCTRGCANFCATIHRLQEVARIFAPPYIVYKRERGFFRHHTSFTRGGTDFCATIHRLQEVARIFSSPYIVYKRYGGAEIRATLRYSGAEIRATFCTQGVVAQKSMPPLVHKV